MFVWTVVTVSLVQGLVGSPADPQLFNGRTARFPSVSESYGCSLPNTSATKYEISFGTSWILYVLCYDKISATPLQSRHQLSPTVSEHAVNTPYSQDQLSSNLITSPAVFYHCSSQINNFKNILGSENQARKLIDCNNGFNLAPSNLVPASDFPFDEQRRAVQYYINTFPQWVTIKNGNWKNLEKSIRKYANSLGRPLMITGGTLGVTTFPDTRGQEQLLYMTENRANLRTVAVPRLVWKLVYDHMGYESIVFVGVNNPYRADTWDLFRNNEVVCNCVCNQTEGWFDGWNRMDFIQGYIYCCTWDEFHLNVGVESLPSTGLLRKK